MKLSHPPKNKFNLVALLVILTTVLLVAPAFAGRIQKMDVNGVTIDVYIPDIPAPRLSEDGKTVVNFRPVILVDDPNPPTRLLRIPPPAELEENPPDRLASAATFSITYAAAGTSDPWGELCQAFPEEAKTAFNAAANVWGSLLTSSVPITISACWANLGNVGTLGYSGGSPESRNFPNAPKANTWYKGSLANSLAGSDLDATRPDMYITYNSNFSWYYGTDGITPGDKHDLMSVVLHEIAHGLNFSGSMSYTGGQGSWGYTTGFPNVYDTFALDGTGNHLIDTTVYPNPSTALGSALTTMDVYFNGANAMAANGGAQVRLYAPAPWAPGSSYAHLDYDTFKGGDNALMVFAISPGVSIHAPGPVTMGLFKDLGWSTGGGAAKPNLTPYTPTNWSDEIVVSKTTNTTVDDTGLTTNDTLYVDWAAINSSNVNITTAFNVTLRVDGVAVNTWSCASLQGGYYVSAKDYSLGKLAAGNHTLEMVIDSGGAIAETNEGDNTYSKTISVTQGGGGSPNLAPYTPTNWSGPIVASKVTGTNVDGGGLTTNDPLYVDWAAINGSNVNITTAFNVTLRVDGVAVNTWSCASLQGGYYVYVQDYALGKLAAGSHTLQLVIDSGGAITESNEGDNTYSKTISVAQAAFPNLTPYKPAGWSSKIVATHKQGAKVDSKLYSGYMIYVDWAVANLGNADITKKFYVRLYVDGVRKKTWSATSLKKSNYLYLLGYPIGGLSPGSHRLQIVADVPNRVKESRETDNQYSRSVRVHR
jgi:hypothetical protein